MKKNVKTALVQFSPWPMRQMEKNVSFISTKMEELAKSGNELIVFPEMSITNFFEHHSNGKQDYWESGSISLDSPQLETIKNGAKQNNCFVVVGFAERSDVPGEIYNSAALIGPEGIVGITRKVHFPGLEKLYYKTTNQIEVHDTPLGKIGICICYDFMFPEVTRALAVKGAEMIVISSSIWAGGEKGGIGSLEYKKTYWDQLPLVKAIENQTYIIACNGGGSHQIGKDLGEWKRLGLSKIVSPTGQILAKVDHQDDAVLTALLDAADIDLARKQYTFLADRSPSSF
jgi:predicted amidohydrolase